MNDPNTILVVLNYNNYADTSLFVNKINKYDEIKKIIIVDNCSQNNSFEILLDEFSKNHKIDVIKSPINGGYAKGNNFGIKYSLLRYRFSNIIIANPDIEITHENLLRLINRKNELDKRKIKVGIVAPSMQYTNGNVNYGWKRPRYIDDLRSSLMVMSKFMGDPLHKFKHRYVMKNTIFVDVVSGSFFLIDKDAMIAIDFFDENTFLYCEERILSFKLSLKKYSNFVLSDCFFYHKTSTSIKSALSETEMYKELNRSKEYYQEKYLKVNLFQKLLFKFIAAIGLNERRLYFSIKQRRLNK